MADSSLFPFEMKLEANRAFALWCAEEDLVEDESAPHGQAFYAGFALGREAEYHAYLRSSVT